MSERASERKELEGEGSWRKSSASSEPLWLREIAGKSDAFSPVEREHRGGDSPKQHQTVGILQINTLDSAITERRDEGELEKVSAVQTRINVGLCD